MVMDLTGLNELFCIWTAASLIVFFAMVGDLGAGLYKAKLRGDARTSYGLKRSVYKFLTYEGAVLVGGCIDVLMHLARMWRLFGVEALANIPVVALVVGIFLCVVELLSIREKADDKTHETMKKVEKVAGKVGDKVLDSFVEALTERIREKGKKE